MCYGPGVRTSSLWMLNHANDFRIRIRNRQFVQVGDNSIARKIVAEPYTRKPKVWLVCKSRSVPIVPRIWNRANKFVQVECGMRTLNVFSESGSGFEIPDWIRSSDSLTQWIQIQSGSGSHTLTANHLCIRIGFIVDPDPAFHLTEIGSSADPDPGQTWKSHKVDFFR